MDKQIETKILSDLVKAFHETNDIDNKTFLIDIVIYKLECYLRRLYKINNL